MSTRDRTESFLAELTNANGAPGFEGPVRDILRREWSDLLVTVRSDGIGNLIGRLPGSAVSPLLLLIAHMDEVAFLVDHVDDDGFVYILPLGGHFDHGVLMHSFTIATAQRDVIAYAGHKSTHVVPMHERSQIPRIKEIFLDVGVRCRKEAEDLGIRPGLPVTYRSWFEELNGGGRYLGKAFDDRAVLAALTEALRLSHRDERPNAVCVAATVQEEVGMRGAAVLPESVNPDLAINLDVSIARDFPAETSNERMRIALGRGPSLFVYDGSLIPNNNLVEWILALARDSGIPLQLEAIGGYCEDGSRLQLSGSGVPTVNLGLPVRYTHGSYGVLDRFDYDSFVRLLTAIINGVNADVVSHIRTF